MYAAENNKYILILVKRVTYLYKRSWPSAHEQNIVTANIIKMCFGPPYSLHETSRSLHHNEMPTIDTCFVRENFQENFVFSSEHRMVKDCKFNVGVIRNRLQTIFIIVMNSHIRKPFSNQSIVFKWS